ncbi:hypothetical protein PFISCL1PPCAC_10877 [Pristionchus fissidentatus]|uniref:RING-type E3 ubiquitin transferase BRCA1 n=1 Tax=Pristionchus fissidentatus TaxID=1538716 RepID=A0AAV5VIT3_9BILA|nr:hypothetical protein PFISCL1PPCAC_10877 [Pristionchus fissidentatus]
MFRAKLEPNTGPPVSSGTAEIIRIVEAIKSELRCGICCSTLKDPVITTCNHLFCRGCYTECLKQLKSLTCPMCKQKLSRRNSKEVEIYTNAVSHYLQLAKAFSRDLQPLALRPADNFLESQAVIVPGSAPSPLRNFQPEHQFAIPTLPSRRRGKRPAGDGDTPAAKRKQPKLEMIGEEEEEEVAPTVRTPSVKRETISPPLEDPAGVPSKGRPSRVKQERRSEEPPDEQQPPTLRRSSRGRSAANEERNSPPIDANIDNGLPRVPLVPYSQSSVGSSVVEGTQSQPEEKEVQTETKEMEFFQSITSYYRTHNITVLNDGQIFVSLDATTQADEKKTTLIEQIACYRDSHPSSSSISDLAILLTIHPEIATIMKQNADEVRHRFLPDPSVETPLQKGRLRMSDVLDKCFATPTGYTDDESEQGGISKTPVGRSVISHQPSTIDRSEMSTEPMLYDGEGEKKEVEKSEVPWIPRRPTRANTEPVEKKEKKKTWMERKREEIEEEKEKKGEEKSEGSDEGSVQAERGEEVVVVAPTPAATAAAKVDDEKWSDEDDDDKEETIAATPEGSARGEEEKEKVETKKPSEVETVALDPFEFDDVIPVAPSPPRLRRSSTRSIKENGEKTDSLPKSAPREGSYDSFNESLVFDTVPEKVEPLGEINLATMQRTPSKKSPRKTPSRRSGQSNKSMIESLNDDDFESQESIVLSVCGVTTRQTEELLAEFRVLFPSILYEQQPERGASHLVVMDSVDRHIRSSSLQLASAHASKCTVLGREWMERCIATRKLIDTSTYGIVSVERGEAPAWQRAKVESPILTGYTILLPVNFADSKALPRERLSALIVKCGGKVVDRPWKLPKTRTPVEAGAPLHNVHSMRSFILFSPGSADSDSAMRFERDTSVAVFTADWLVDSLSQYSIIITDTDRYRVALTSIF